MAEASYQDWLTYIFDREATEDGEAWYSSEPAAIELSPRRAAEYTTRAFGDAALTLRRYSDAQIARGLDYITNTMVSDHGHFLHNGEVPQDERIDAINSMAALFRGVFDPRCRPVLSHIDEPGGGLLNMVCYMWWDVLPLFAEPGGHRPNPIDDSCLSVMRETLALANPACQESALHGLGHWAGAYPMFAAGAIDGFLAANPELRPELRAYALAARSGCVQ